jgi:hypothetical protein
VLIVFLRVKPHPRRFFCTPPRSFTVQKSILLAAIQKEIQRHDLSYFVDEPPSVAQGGKGVVVAGRPACRKRINTVPQFLDHLANDAMPALIARLAANHKSGADDRIETL